jgi:hypothetical protein
VRKKRVDPAVEASPETERKAAQASSEAIRVRRGQRPERRSGDGSE